MRRRKVPAPSPSRCAVLHPGSLLLRVFHLERWILPLLSWLSGAMQSPRSASSKGVLCQQGRRDEQGKGEEDGEREDERECRPCHPRCDCPSCEMIDREPARLVNTLAPPRGLVVRCSELGGTSRVRFRCARRCHHLLEERGARAAVQGLHDTQSGSLGANLLLLCPRVRRGGCRRRSRSTAWRPATMPEHHVGDQASLSSRSAGFLLCSSSCPEPIYSLCVPSVPHGHSTGSSVS